MRGTPTDADKREFRNFERFLRLSVRHLPEMMTRPRWQKYLNVTPREAWVYAKQVKRKRAGV